MTKRMIFSSLLLCLFSLPIHANILVVKGGEAFGSPGLQANWASAKNVHVGTFLEKNESPLSPVWFTTAKGMLTEVFYPTIDTAQIKDSQFIVSDGKSFMVEEKNLKHDVEVLSASMVKIGNYDRKGRFEIHHTFFTLGDSATIVDEVEVKVNQDGLNFYLLTNPHISNTGSNDRASTSQDGFLAIEGKSALSVRTTAGFRNKSVGFVGFSDGWQDISRDYKMDYAFEKATGGNVSFTGEVDIPAKKGTYKFYVVYSFTDNKKELDPILPNYKLAKKKYESTWADYFATLKKPSNVSENELALYYRSLYVLKVHEDKRNPGALIASLSIPWGEKQFEVPGQKIGGYHLIWPRDLYHVALALLSAGDMESPMNALRFLKKIQYDETDGNWNLSPRVIPKSGAFPQNTWVSGENYWGGLQIDQVGYPIHLFYQVYSKQDLAGQSKMLKEFRPMIEKALNFIISYGPWSQQERWEENFGISPSSFSVATSALIIGSKLFNNDFGRKLRNVANGWLTKPGDNIDTWTYTTNGVYGDGSYYLRIAGGDSFGASWNPDLDVNTHIANSGRRVNQKTMLDQGFLKLALMGLRPASDNKLKKSKALVDENISVVTPRGRGWYRYSFDAYGEQDKGRLWPLLSSEHGRFAIERYRVGDLSWDEVKTKTQPIVDSYLGFANDGLMIPEQIFEHNGKGTGAATPLAWSHAEYIKLLLSVDQKHNLENILTR